MLRIVKFEDLPEPKHVLMSFRVFITHTWYWYLIVAPFMIFNQEIMDCICWFSGLLNDPLK